MSEPETTSNLLGWLGALASVLGGGTWLGRVHGRANRNSEDINKLVENMGKHLEEDREMHERMATIEADLRHIRDAVDRKL